MGIFKTQGFWHFKSDGGKIIAEIISFEVKQHEVGIVLSVKKINTTLKRGEENQHITIFSLRLSLKSPTMSVKVIYVIQYSMIRGQFVGYLACNHRNDKISICTAKASTEWQN